MWQSSAKVVAILVTGPIERTLRSSFSLSGMGIHTGGRCRVTLHPADPGYGRRFVLDGSEIEAVAENVADTRRCTRLASGGASVSTVEHLMSALAAMGVDSARIEVDGEELPILDGSALPWAEAILGAGIARLGTRSKRIRLLAPIRAACDGSLIEGIPAARSSLVSVTAFAHPMLGTELRRSPKSAGEYLATVAPARTFGMEEEVEALRASGLAAGANLENALVVHADRFSGPERVPGECHAHKLLDLIGDIALAGHPIDGEIVAIRPGHRVNAAFAMAVRGAAGLCG